jgi:nucleotide-binding universal stress UspA family protein
MEKSGSRKTTYLTLDKLAPNPSLARRLPAELARRLHVLPLSEDSGRVTVAMANPDDVMAREVIDSMLGPAPCVVQGNEGAIDAWLAAIWGEESNTLHITVCDFPEPLSTEVLDYARALGDLLGAHLGHIGTASEMETVIEGPDGPGRHLLIVQDPGHPLLKRLLPRATYRPASDRKESMSPAVVVVRRPRWPIKRVLLIVCGNEGDSATTDWVLQLAKRGQSAVTVLAIVPPAPAMYGRRACGDEGLPDLLAADTPLGSQMRQVAARLVDWGIEGTLRLRQGPPDWQVCREMAESDCDLVAVASRPCSWLLRWLGDDLSGCILQRVERPVLVAIPKIA